MISSRDQQLIDQAKRSALGPGICLLLGSMINVIVGVLLVYFSRKVEQTSDAELLLHAKASAKQTQKMFPSIYQQQEQQAKAQGMSYEEATVQGWRSGSKTGLIAGGIMSAMGVFCMFGASRIMYGHSRVLGLIASGLSVIPCLSPACCLLIGVVGGIWGFLALGNPDVKEGFRLNSMSESELAAEREQEDNNPSGY